MMSIIKLCESPEELFDLGIELELEIIKLKLEKDFLFTWLVDLLDRKEDNKGKDSMNKLVQDAIGDYIRIKSELSQE